MNDRDDYPDNPYRGRADREGGYDYDPLTDPLAAQPPSRGRRARPGPPDAAGPVGPPHTSTGEFRTPQYAPRPDDQYDPLGPGGGPPTGRRHRGVPQDEQPRRGGAAPQGEPPRRGGAAEALRGSRAARSAAQRQGGPAAQPPAGGTGPPPGAAQPPAAPPTGGRTSGARPAQPPAPPNPSQDGLAALAGLGSPTPSAPQAPPAAQAPQAPQAPQQPVEPEERPRRGRRARPGPPDASGPVDAGPASGSFAEPEEPVGRRARRKRAKRAPDPDEGGFLSDVPEDDSVFDTGSFPGLHQSADTGAFAVVSEPEDGPRRGRRRGRDPEPPPPEDEPRGRFGRRKRARRGGEPAAEADAFPAEAPQAPDSSEPGPFESGSFEQVARDEEPQGRPRRGRGRRRGRAEQTPDEEPGGRRPRRARRGEEPAEDAGAFRADAPEAPGSFESGPFESGSFESGPFDSGAIEPGPFDSGAFEQAEEPVGRRGRAADAPDEEFTTGETPVEAPVEEEPVGRRSRRRRAGAPTDDGEPTGRRRRRRGRGRRASDGFDVEDPREPLPEPEPEPEAQDDEEDDYEYEEPALDDIAAAYGNGRRQREMARRAKQARQRKGGSGKARRKRKSKGMMIALVLVLVLVVVGGGYGIVRTYVFPADFSGEGSGEVLFTIEDGDSGTAVGANLADAGVVASVRAFTNALDAVPPEEAGEGLVPGSYTLAEGMSGESAVAALLDPDNRLGGRVTIREGLRSEEIFEHLSTELGIPVADFEEAYADTDSLGLPEYATAGPEGYLFPETYRFDAGTDAGVVLNTMVTHFTEVADEIELEDRAAAIDRDPNEIMAIASIIQAETGNEEDMPLISAVVHNRLALNMELQMDSTCFYVLGEKGTFLNDEQRATCEADPQGYSTYGMAGLPEGPFVPPGQEAIEAALEPADEDYLYFALTDPENGVTEFSETLEEHNQMVAENQGEW